MTPQRFEKCVIQNMTKSTFSDADHFPLMWTRNFFFPTTCNILYDCNNSKEVAITERLNIEQNLVYHLFFKS